MKNLPKEELLSRLEAINRSNAIIYFDLNGIILGVNNIFLESMGYKEGDHEKIIGKHHSIFVTPEYADTNEYKEFWKKLGNGNFHEGEFERIREDGKTIYLQFSNSRLVSLDKSESSLMTSSTI